MKPYDHAELSAKKFGGEYTDYIDIHKWFDQFRLTVTDPRHRAFLHNTVGVGICEQVFGDYVENNAGKRISVRDVAEDHIIRDVGEVRSPMDWLNNLNDPEYVKPIPSKLETLEKKFRKEDLELFEEKMQEHLQENHSRDCCYEKLD